VLLSDGRNQLVSDDEVARICETIKATRIRFHTIPF
jgi:hypothetical protein